MEEGSPGPTPGRSPGEGRRWRALWVKGAEKGRQGKTGARSRGRRTTGRGPRRRASGEGLRGRGEGQGRRRWGLAERPQERGRGEGRLELACWGQVEGVGWRRGSRAPRDGRRGGTLRGWGAGRDRGRAGAAVGRPVVGPDRGRAPPRAMDLEHLRRLRQGRLLEAVQPLPGAGAVPPLRGPWEPSRGRAAAGAGGPRKQEPGAGAALGTRAPNSGGAPGRRVLGWGEPAAGVGPRVLGAVVPVPRADVAEQTDSLKQSPRRETQRQRTQN